jgi:hypothetical protein
MGALYDRDFHAWAQEQASLLRSGRLSEADVNHIAEEIESMGKTEKRELVSRLTVLLLHLLKWRYQPERRGRSWEATIRVQRGLLADHLTDNPSLKAQLLEAIAAAYRYARIEAGAETGLADDLLPETCEWRSEQIMATDFWPDRV